MLFTITLNPALDYVIKTESLRNDDINRAIANELYCGGKGINVSIILSELGIDNTALGFIAGFTGDELEKRLKAAGISCNFNRLENGSTRINIKIKADEEIDINARGPEISDTDIESLINKLENIANNGDFIVLSGSIPKGVSPDIYERIIRRLANKKIEFIVDSEGEALMDVLRYRPFLIKPNHHELGELFGIDADADDIIEKCAKKLQKTGARNVLVSRAEKGAMLIDEAGAVHLIKSAEGKLINSSGCGDSMVAGFLAGYIKEKDYSYALKLGAACGSATAFSEGLASRETISKVFKNQHGFNL